MWVAKRPSAQPAFATGKRGRGSVSGNPLPIPHAPYVSPVVISPDGRHIAYTGRKGRLEVQDLDHEQPRKIEGAEGAQFPCWSPDSGWIGFVAGHTLRKVSIEGGSPFLVAKLPAPGVSGVNEKGDGGNLISSAGRCRSPLSQIAAGKRKR